MDWADLRPTGAQSAFGLGLGSSRWPGLINFGPFNRCARLGLSCRGAQSPFCPNVKDY